MFELIPFDRHIRSAASFDPFRMLDEMDRHFFNSAPAVSTFRTDVIDTGIEASYTDGMLNLTLPKKAAEIPASRRLEIK